MDASARENVDVIERVIQVFAKLQIGYVLGGSWASSIHGKTRFTHDADFTCDPFPGKETDFCASFGSDYYVSEAAVRQAVQRRSSYNILHTKSGFKVDVFVRKDRPFEQGVIGRARTVTLPGLMAWSLMSPEDIILYKLEWYRLGGESSERQWQDILEVFKIQGERLDQAYLDRWASDLTVADLLARVRQDAAG